MRALQFVTLCGLATLAAIPASADIFNFNFTSDHCSGAGGCSNNGALNPMGAITVTDIAGGVSVDVTLDPGFGFVVTGAGTGHSGNASFFFNTTTGSTITITGLSGGWSIPNVTGGDMQAVGQYAGDGLMNDYNHGLTCSSCGPGGSNPNPGPLDFNVTGVTGLTAADFVSSPFFGADVISSNGNTGLIDASAGTVVITSPEPSSVILFGSILIGVAEILRRRAQRKA